eukprot:4008986-Amphidinium_carterae.1
MVQQPNVFALASYDFNSLHRTMLMKLLQDWKYGCGGTLCSVAPCRPQETIFSRTSGDRFRTIPGISWDLQTNAMKMTVKVSSVI